MVDIILSKIPFPTGKNVSTIIRVSDPTSLTWDSIFNFIEERSHVPRLFMACTDSNGKYIYGDSHQYPVWNYEDYRMSNQNGDFLSTAIINIHSIPRFGKKRNWKKGTHVLTYKTTHPFGFWTFYKCPNRETATLFIIFFLHICNFFRML